jgi:hypothetical protein
LENIMQDVPEIILHLKMRQRTSPFLRNFLSTLEQQLKSWDVGGNREYLRPAIERTIRTIEAARQ